MQRPHLKGTGMGVHRVTGSVLELFHALQARLRDVRVCCGDWSRVLGSSPTEKLGTTGIFLDPPYSAEAGRENALYGVEDLTVAHAVREWALAHGDNPLLRIALCGYEGEHAMSGWTCVPWKTIGGYAGQSGKTNANATRERIWFSPACLSATPLERYLFQRDQAEI